MKTRGGTIETGYRCPVCHDEIDPGKQHCVGPGLSFYRASVAELVKEGFSFYKRVPEYHHGIKHDRCWKCSGDMGCSMCVPNSAELFCRRCNVAANRQTFLESGPPCGFTLEAAGGAFAWGDRSAEFPKLQEYPRDWLAAWISRCNQAGVDWEGDGREEFLAVRAGIEQLIRKEPRQPTRKRLAIEKARQELAEARTQ